MRSSRCPLERVWDALCCRHSFVSTLTIASYRLGTQHGTRNAAASMAISNSSVLNTSLDRQRLGLFGWWLDDCHALLLFLSSALSYILSYRTCCFPSPAWPKYERRIPAARCGSDPRSSKGSGRDFAARWGRSTLRPHPVPGRVQCPALQVGYFFDSTQILLFAQVKVGVKNPVK
jgi:hypothetical protein